MSRIDVEPLTDDERTQLHLVLRHTTPAERIEWLEDMRLAFGIEHHRKALALRFKMQDIDNGFMAPPADDR